MHHRCSDRRLFTAVALSVMALIWVLSGCAAPQSADAALVYPTPDPPSPTATFTSFPSSTPTRPSPATLTRVPTRTPALTRTRQMASPTAPPTATSVPTASPTATPEWTGYQCDQCIKGNISYESGEKIYHIPGCEYFEETRINSDYGERWFSSEAEALAAGWRKALNCP